MFEDLETRSGRDCASGQPCGNNFEILIKILSFNSPVEVVFHVRHLKSEGLEEVCVSWLSDFSELLYRNRGLKQVLVIILS